MAVIDRTLNSTTSVLVIERGVGDDPSTVDRFEIPFEAGASILDGLIWIRTHIDPSLAFRYSCINANVCKECVVLVDGKKDYACTARLKSGPINLQALPNKKRVRDLACETVPPKERLT